MQGPLLGRRSPALRPIFTSHHSRQLSVCRATGSEPEKDWTPVLGTSSRIFSCLLAASVAFGSPEYLLDADPAALALEFPSSTEQRQALNQRRRDILREAKERALQQVSSDGESGKSEDTQQEKVPAAQKSTLDLLTESVQEQQKRYDEQISKSKIPVPKSGSTRSFTSPELPKFSFPSFGGSSKKTEEASKKAESSRDKKSSEMKSEIKGKQDNAKLSKTESPDSGSSFSDFMKKYGGGSSEETPKTVIPKTPPPVVSKPKEELTTPKSESGPLIPDFMQKSGAPEEKAKPVVPSPLFPKLKEEPGKPKAETPSPFSDLLKKYSPPEEKPKPGLPSMIPKPRPDPVKPETSAPSTFSDFMKKYGGGSPEEQPKPVTPKTPPPVVPKPRVEPMKPQDQSVPALPDFLKKYSAPEEKSKPALPPVVVPKPKPETTAPSRFSDLVKKYSAPEERPAPVQPKAPPPIVSKPSEESAKPRDENTPSLPDFMTKYSPPEETPKPLLPPVMIPEPKPKPIEPESKTPSRFSDLMKKYSAPEEKPRPIVPPPPPPKVPKPKEEPAEPKGEEGLSFSDFMKKYGAPEETPKPVIPPPVISVPRQEPRDSGSVQDLLKKKYESKETSKPSTPTRQQIPRKVEQKKVQKAKKRGVLPLWATQFLMLGLFGGFIYCFTALYDTTSKITKSTFITIDQFLEDLKFSYDANQSSNNNKS